ncbi:MAG: DUF1698 domain-containing protein, partial [Desulfuromonadales bacterium]|nr:DUF1698 domain-containing protein [Desulfuromonadales bacterium]
MNFYDALYPQLDAMGQHCWSQQLQKTLPEKFLPDSHGKMAGWLKALTALPEIRPSRLELKDQVAIGGTEDLGATSREELTAGLQAFHPWRKGPYNVFGIEIDTEWRSDWKWERLLPHIQPLAGRRVLDVGCGNGYHGWRMRGAGADFVLGIEPFLLSV